jgi:hypothetical protein
MMTFKNGVGQIIELALAATALIPLPMSFSIMPSPLMNAA